MKTRKLLSIVMAVMMLFGCLGLSASAIELPDTLEPGTAVFKGLAEIASVEIPVEAKYTAVSSEAVITVYYSAEAEENILDVLDREEVGTVGAGDVYLVDNVLHVNLKGLGLSDEGYYYIAIGAGSLEYADEYADRYNSTATTEGVLYQFNSLDVGAKISAIFDYVISLVMNLISNGKAY